MKTIHVIIGCGAVAVLLGICLVIFGFLHFQRLASAPTALQNPRIVMGSGFVGKAALVRNPQLGRVTDIVVESPDRTHGNEIAIAGSKGAALIDRNGQVKASVAFADPADQVNVIPMKGSGPCEFMNRGSWTLPASLIDPHGRTLWTCNAPHGVDDMAAGDLNDDGTSEFVVGFNRRVGIRLVDHYGKQIWQQPDSRVRHVEIADINADGKLDIIHSNERGWLTVRDATGRVISTTKPPFYLGYFSISKWPSWSGRQYVVQACGDKIWILDGHGQAVAQMDAPASGSIGATHATPVTLKGGQPDYFAVVVEFKLGQRSVLYIYDSKGVLVYQEALMGQCGSVAAMPLPYCEAEALLLGGDGVVWQYRAR